MAFGIDAILKLVVLFLDFYMKRWAVGEQAKKDYIAFVEIMNRKGLSAVRMRNEAQTQVERIKELWDSEAGNTPELPKA